MTDHLSSQTMEAFCARTLALSEMTAVATHLAECALCQSHCQRVLTVQQAPASMTISLLAEDWFRDEHLSYEELTSFADGTLEPEQAAIIDLHLSGCERCREDVCSLLEFRQQTAAELTLRYAPEPASPPVPSRWKRAFLIWQPLTAGLLILIGLTTLLVWLAGVKKGREEQVRHQPPITKPSPVTAMTPAPSSSPAMSGTTRNSPASATTVDNDVTLLRDAGRIVRVHQSGKITGLDHLPAGLRQAAAETLLARRLPQPLRPEDLRSDEGVLRGTTEQSAFRLLSPAGRVITETRPTFRWEPLAVVQNWRVQVADASGQEVADSGLLPAARIQRRESGTGVKGRKLFMWDNYVGQ